ncbi:MAG TPA: VCBS repeat-containing protein [Candidatus Methylomirabilis sp.]|nr:VCBS repeat-containing protein [Candidatus Methylomirabilis sp.]
MTGATTFSLSPNGTCTAASCSATVPGLHTVTGNDGGKTATASLTVLARTNRDFNGDGRSDVLWWHSSGLVYEWLLNGAAPIGTGSPGSTGTDWTIVGVGDFNGDGKADILWRHKSGVVYLWLMDGTSISGSGSPGAVGTAGPS